MQRLRSTHLEGQTFLLLGVFIVLAAFFSITESRFLTNRSITSMAFQLPEIGVLSLAMMITILVGGINLSVNATSNLAAVVAGLFLVHILPADAAMGIQNLYVALAMGIALLIGLLCGVLNGFLVGIIQVPPILATLATFTFFTGISTGLTGGATVTGFPPGLAVLGAQSLLGIPIPFLVFVLLTIFIFVLLNQTTYGFKMRMLGSNPTAANFTGVNNKVIIMQVYIMSGLLSAITGMIIMSRTMSAAYEYGTTTYVLLTILISVLAGILPGFGSVFNIFVAVLILQVLSTGFHMILAGVRGSAFFRDFAWGILLIIIFIINFFIRSKKQKE
jgi:simple sugar transport system permease protein